jgi:HPt (histidine-containing phosphotransfer) domain-containing protein
VQVSDSTITLNRDQLRDITLDDEELMREVLTALVDDTSRQIQLLAAAIEQGDSERVRRLAHYSKGACANVGADAAASLLNTLELQGRSEHFSGCRESLTTLQTEVERLKKEAGLA